MKRILALLVICSMSAALFGCSKAGNGSGGDSGNGGDEPKATTVADNGGADEDTGVDFSQKGGKVEFKVDSSIILNEMAWLGFCPGTKGYKKEADADEVDVLYAYIENDERKASEDYIFQFDDYLIEGLEDGNYIVVLCDDDDETIGKVVLYFPAVIEGSKVTCDFSKVTVNK